MSSHQNGHPMNFGDRGSNENVHEWSQGTFQTLMQSHSKPPIDSFRSSNFGPSRINPHNMQNNCVSVAIAHLEQYNTVDDLWTVTDGQSLPDRPLSLEAIVSLLERTGEIYHFDIFESGPRKTAFQKLETRYRRHKPGPSFAVYWRPGSIGHTVNILYTVTTPLQYGLKFIDYQRDTRGEICQEITEAEKIYIFRRRG